MTTVIMEPRELYGFLSTPGVEVMNIAFASDDVVWISWKYGAEEDVPSLRNTKEVIGAYVTAGAKTICTAIPTVCERSRFLVTRTR